MICVISLGLDLALLLLLSNRESSLQVTTPEATTKISSMIK